MKANIAKLSMTILFSMYSMSANAGLIDAGLIDRGGGLIYDSVNKITWLQDANYAMTSGYYTTGTNGRMTWAEAVNWAEQLEYGGFSDWRLPASLDVTYSYGYDGSTSAGFNVTSSEMGSMYYINLEGEALRIPNPDYDPNITGSLQYITNSDFQEVAPSPFFNLQYRAYWSGTAYTNHQYGDRAWVFNFGDGSQGYSDIDILKDTSAIYNAWAVRDGDVLPVPEPTTMLLFCAGLAGLAAVSRRKKTC